MFKSKLKEIVSLLFISGTFCVCAQTVPILEEVYQFGGSQTDYSAGLLVDKQNDLYVFGNYKSTFDFDFGSGVAEVVPIASHDAIIAKYTSSNQFLWVGSFGGDGYDQITGVEEMANGDLIVIGQFGKGLYYNNVGPLLTSTKNSNAFVARVSKEGVLEWVRGFVGIESGDNRTYIQDLAIDSKGDVYTIGQFRGTMVLGTSAAADSLSTIDDYEDVFVGKFSSNGDVVYTKQIGSASFDVGVAVAVDSDDNLYIGGYFSNTLDLDWSASDALLYNSSAIIPNGFLAKYNALGEYQWAKHFKGNACSVSHIEISPNNELNIVGGFKDSLSESSNDFLYSTTSSSFIAKYSADGTKSFLKPALTNNNIVNYDVKLDANSNIYLAGSYMMGDLTHLPTGQVMKNEGGTDLHLTRFNSNGDLDWIRTINSESSERGVGIHLLPDGFYVSGDFRDTIDLNPYGAEYILIDVPDYIGSSETGIFLAKYRYCDITFSNLVVTETCAYTSPSGKVFKESGVYTDTILNTYGCDSIITIQLTIDLQNQISTADVTCPEDLNGKVTLNTTGGTAPYTYAVFDQVYNQPSPFIGFAGKGTYVVTTTDKGGSGCSVVDTFMIGGVSYADICSDYSLQNYEVCTGDTVLFSPGVLDPGFIAIWSRPNGTIDTITNPFEEGKSIDLKFHAMVSAMSDTGYYSIIVEDVRSEEESVCTCPIKMEIGHIRLLSQFAGKVGNMFRRDSFFVAVEENIANAEMQNTYAWYADTDKNVLLGKSQDDHTLGFKESLSTFNLQKQGDRTFVNVWAEDLSSFADTLLGSDILALDSSATIRPSDFKHLIIVEKEIDFVSFNIAFGNIGYNSTYRFNGEVYNNTKQSVWNGSALVDMDVPNTNSKVYTGSEVKVTTAGNEIVRVPLNITLAPGKYWIGISYGGPNIALKYNIVNDTLRNVQDEVLISTGLANSYNTVKTHTPFRDFVVQSGNPTTCGLLPVKIWEQVHTCNDEVPTIIETATAGDTCSINNERAFTYFASPKKLIASVHDRGNDLGEVMVFSKVYDDVLYADNQYFAPKVISIYSTFAPSTEVSVRVYYTEQELNELLKSNASTKREDLEILSFSGYGAQGLLGTGVSIPYTMVEYIDLSPAYVFEFKTSSLSTFALATPKYIVNDIDVHSQLGDKISINNPVNNELKITIGNELVGAKFELISIMGQSIYSGVFDAITSVFDVAHCTSGTYVLSVTKGNVSDKRIVIIE